MKKNRNWIYKLLLAFVVLDLSEWTEMLFNNVTLKLVHIVKETDTIM